MKIRFREETWYVDKMCRHLQVASHEKWVSGEAKTVPAKIFEGHLLVSLRLRSIVSSVDLKGLLMSRTGKRLPLGMAGMPCEFTKKLLENRKTAKLLRLRHLCGKRLQVLKSNSQSFFPAFWFHDSHGLPLTQPQRLSL